MDREHTYTRRSFVKCALAAAGGLMVGEGVLSLTNPLHDSAYALDLEAAAYGRLSTLDYSIALSTEYSSMGNGFGRLRPGSNITFKSLMTKLDPEENSDNFASCVDILPGVDLVDAELVKPNTLVYKEAKSLDESAYESISGDSIPESPMVLVNWQPPVATTTGTTYYRKGLTYLGSTNSDVASVYFLQGLDTVNESRWQTYMAGALFDVSPKSEGSATLYFATRETRLFNTSGDGDGGVVSVTRSVLPLRVQVGEGGNNQGRWESVEASYIIMLHDNVDHGWAPSWLQVKPSGDSVDSSASWEQRVTNEVMDEYRVGNAFDSRSVAFDLTFLFPGSSTKTDEERESFFERYILSHISILDAEDIDFDNLSSFTSSVASTANEKLSMTNESFSNSVYKTDADQGILKDATYPPGSPDQNFYQQSSLTVNVDPSCLKPGHEYALYMSRMPTSEYPYQAVVESFITLLLADKDILIRFTTAPADAAEIALGKDNLLMAAGATYQLVAKAKADDGSEYSAGFTWTSSDEDIVEVAEDGTVTAHAVGSATITVAADHGGVSAQCSITVVAVPEKASFVEGDSLSVTIDKAFDLTPAIDGDEKVAALFAWRFAEVEGITANADGTFTATKPGSFEMTASIVVDDDLFVLPEGFDSASLPVATATVKAEFATETPGGPLEDKSGDSPATGDAISSAALPQTGDAASVLAAAAAVAAVAGVGAAAGAAHKMKDADAE